MDYQDDLKKALRLADIADEIGMKYFMSRDLVIETKPDNSPVTQGDKEIEQKLSDIVINEFGDSYYGEEGTDSGDGKRRWLVDPIDGTKNFMRGFPVWGSLISLKDGDEVIAASISAPALGRRWWATKNGGAFAKDVNGNVRKINVSKVEKISDSFILMGTLNSWEKVNVDPNLVVKLMRTAWRHRGPGDFFGHMLVAEGVADCFPEIPSAQWDIEAATLIVQEAGGNMWTTATEKTPINQFRIAISSNKKVEQEVVEFLGLH